MTTIAKGLLQELEQEAQSTARVLQRVPNEHLDWRPHAKSYSLGQLALHVAQIPGNVAMLAMEDPAVPPSFVQERAESAAALIPALEDSIRTAQATLAAVDDDTMMRTWRLMVGDHEVLSMPRVAFLRAIMLNHWYHHRGQLMVYLRQLEVPLPSVYGPTADENPFAEPLAAR